MSMLSSNSSCTPKDIKNQSDLVKFDVQTGFEEFLAGLRNLSVVLAILLPIDWILEGTQAIHTSGAVQVFILQGQVG